MNLNISGAANSTNNGSFKIAEIVSSSVVRIEAPFAAGADANSGALSWSISGPAAVAPSSFTSINTLNIGVG